jgi:hypothetical protein
MSVSEAAVRTRSRRHADPSVVQRESRNGLGPLRPPSRPPAPVRRRPTRVLKDGWQLTRNTLSPPKQEEEPPFFISFEDAQALVSGSWQPTGEQAAQLAEFEALVESNFYSGGHRPQIEWDGYYLKNSGPALEAGAQAFGFAMARGIDNFFHLLLGHPHGAVIFAGVIGQVFADSFATPERAAFFDQKVLPYVNPAIAQMRKQWTGESMRETRAEWKQSFGGSLGATMHMRTVADSGRFAAGAVLGIPASFILGQPIWQSMLVYGAVRHFVPYADDRMHLHDVLEDWLNRSFDVLKGAGSTAARATDFYKSLRPDLVRDAMIAEGFGPVAEREAARHRLVAQLAFDKGELVPDMAEDDPQWMSRPVPDEAKRLATELFGILLSKEVDPKFVIALQRQCNQLVRHPGVLLPEGHWFTGWDPSTVFPTPWKGKAGWQTPKQWGEHALELLTFPNKIVYESAQGLNQLRPSVRKRKPENVSVIHEAEGALAILLAISDGVRNAEENRCVKAMDEILGADDDKVLIDVVTCLMEGIAIDELHHVGDLSMIRDFVSDRSRQILVEERTFLLKAIQQAVNRLDPASMAELLDAAGVAPAIVRTGDDFVKEHPTPEAAAKRVQLLEAARQSPIEDFTPDFSRFNERFAGPLLVAWRKLQACENEQVRRQRPPLHWTSGPKPGSAEALLRMTQTLQEVRASTQQQFLEVLRERQTSSLHVGDGPALSDDDIAARATSAGQEAVRRLVLDLAFDVDAGLELRIAAVEDEGESKKLETLRSKLRKNLLKERREWENDLRDRAMVTSVKLLQDIIFGLEELQRDRTAEQLREDLPERTYSSPEATEFRRQLVERGTVTTRRPLTHLRMRLHEHEAVTVNWGEPKERVVAAQHLSRAMIASPGEEVEAFVEPLRRDVQDFLLTCQLNLDHRGLRPQLAGAERHLAAQLALFERQHPQDTDVVQRVVRGLDDLLTRRDFASLDNAMTAARSLPDLSDEALHAAAVLSETTVSAQDVRLHADSIVAGAPPVVPTINDLFVAEAVQDVPEETVRQINAVLSRAKIERDVTTATTGILPDGTRIRFTHPDLQQLAGLCVEAGLEPDALDVRAVRERFHPQSVHNLAHAYLERTGEFLDKWIRVSGDVDVRPAGTVSKETKQWATDYQSWLVKHVEMWTAEDLPEPPDEGSTPPPRTDRGRGPVSPTLDDGGHPDGRTPQLNGASGAVASAIPAFVALEPPTLPVVVRNGTAPGGDAPVIVPRDLPADSAPGRTESGVRRRWDVVTAGHFGDDVADSGASPGVDNGNGRTSASNSSFVPGFDDVVVPPADELVISRGISFD